MHVEYSKKRGRVSLVLDGMAIEVKPEVAIALANALAEAGGLAWVGAFAVPRVETKDADK